MKFAMLSRVRGADSVSGSCPASRLRQLVSTGIFKTCQSVAIRDASANGFDGATYSQNDPVVRVRSLYRRLWKDCAPLLMFPHRASARRAIHFRSATMTDETPG